MIVAFVSMFNGVGKSLAADIFHDQCGFRKHSLMEPVRQMVSGLIKDEHGKDDIHPVLGITRREIVDMIGGELAKKHPDLPIYMVKRRIEAQVARGLDVVIDDCRRQREFTWLTELARTHGTVFRVVEIVPKPGSLKVTRDTWRNGLEPCGPEAWPSELLKNLIENDGAGSFVETVKKIGDGFVEEENERQASLRS